jgi:hypothetical protein
MQLAAIRARGPSASRVKGVAYLRRDSLAASRGAGEPVPPTQNRAERVATRAPPHRISVLSAVSEPNQFFGCSFPVSPAGFSVSCAEPDGVSPPGEAAGAAPPAAGAAAGVAMMRA